MEKTDAQTRQIDPAELDDRVARMLGNGPVTIIDWHAEPLHGGFEERSAVVRWQGRAICNAQSLPWSLVVKKVSPDQANNETDGFRYWKREILAYQTGFFARLPGSLSTPRCLDIEEQPDQSVWLWLEDVADDHGGAWPLEAYRKAAYQLGLFNGAYRTGLPLPSEAWISRRWLRDYVENAAPMVEFIRSHPHHPLVKSLYGGNLAFILALWQTHSDLLDVLERMPQTFCHQDAFKRNLFFQKGKLVAIDWSYAGIAPLGAELVPLVCMSLGFGSIPTDKIYELDRLCLEGYRQGLEEAGVKVSVRSLRRCFTITLLLRYLLGANVGEVLPGLLDQSRHEWLEQGFNQSIEEVSKTDPNITRYYLSIFTEAMKLMGVKPLLKILLSTLRFRFPL